MHRVRFLSSLVVVGLLAAACDIQTTGAPKGELTLYATFDDVQDLARGHFVEMSDVPVGSVADLELDGHRVRVRLDVDEDRTVPAGTKALIRRTSLLGANFVELVPPDQDRSGPPLDDGDEIAETGSQVELEELAARAGTVIGAIDAQSLSGTINAADRALTGRGERIGELISRSRDIVSTVQDQQGALTGTIDALGALGAQFAPAADDLADLIGSFDQATATVAANRDRAVVTAEALVELARTTTDEILAPHTEAILDLFDQADPVLAAIAARAESISGLFDDVVAFNSVLPTVIANGQVLIQAWLDPFVLIGGQQNLDPTDPVRLITSILNGVL
jgi:phospholipid/cholesterol/gamma-HCH transport system substrate-binding protein